MRNFTIKSLMLVAFFAVASAASAQLVTYERNIEISKKIRQSHRANPVWGDFTKNGYMDIYYGGTSGAYGWLTGGFLIQNEGSGNFQMIDEFAYEDYEDTVWKVDDEGNAMDGVHFAVYGKPVLKISTMKVKDAHFTAEWSSAGFDSMDDVRSVMDTFFPSAENYGQYIELYRTTDPTSNQSAVKVDGYTPVVTEVEDQGNVIRYSVDYSNLPKYDDDGNEYYYSMRQTHIDGISLLGGSDPAQALALTFNPYDIDYEHQATMDELLAYGLSAEQAEQFLGSSPYYSVAPFIGITTNNALYGVGENQKFLNIIVNGDKGIFTGVGLIG